jgi:hypothetical protein
MNDEWKTYIDGLDADSRDRLLAILKEQIAEKYSEDLEADEIYREGQKEAFEEIMSGWEFEPTLDVLADRGPPMVKHLDGIMLFRYPFPEEENEVLYEGREVRFPVRYGYDDIQYEVRTIPQKQWNAGERWTLKRIWTTASAIYSKNKRKAIRDMGDHIFFEGVGEDGTIHCGS